MNELLKSKKFVASALASILAIAGLYLGFPIEQVLTAIAPMVGYTVSQGLADVGKEKSKIENVAVIGYQLQHQERNKIENEK